MHRPVAPSILVCSPHSILVSGFRTVVAPPAGLAVVDCPDIARVRELLSSSSAALLLIDTDFSPAFPHVSANTAVILWVQDASPEFVRHRLAAGVRGILRKDAPLHLYLECLARVSAGEVWLEPEMSQRLLRSRAIRLSPRERQLLGLLTEGLRNKEIAGRMNITEGTAKAYLSRLFEKTGAGDRFELAMFALKNLECGPLTTVCEAMPALP